MRQTSWLIIAALIAAVTLSVCSTPVGDVQVSVIPPLQDCSGGASGEALIKDKCADGVDVYLLPKDSTTKFIKMEQYKSPDSMEFTEIPLNSCRTGCRFELICYKSGKPSLRGLSDVFIIDQDMAKDGTPAQTSILLSPVDGFSPVPDPSNKANCLRTINNGVPLIGFGAASVELADGKVLFMGGFKAPAAGSDVSKNLTKEVPLNTGFILDPSTGAITPVEMKTPRAFHTMTRLMNGQVFIAGGYGGVTAGSVKTAEIFDPTQAKVDARTLVMREARDGHEAVLLADGKVMLIGGRKVTQNGDVIDYIRSSEIFNPNPTNPNDSTAFFAEGPTMNNARAFFSAVKMDKGRILVVGGRGANSVVKEIEFVSYNPQLATPKEFSNKFPPDNKTQELKFGRYAVGAVHSTDNTLEREKILVVGGYTAVFEEGEFSGKSRENITNTLEMVHWPYGTSAGYSPISAQDCGKLPSNNGAARLQVTPLKILSVESAEPVYGDALISGGWNQTTQEPLNTAFIYRFLKGDGNPNACTMDPEPASQALSLPRVGHTAVLLSDGRVILAGGYTKEGGTWSVATTVDLFTPQPP